MYTNIHDLLLNWLTKENTPGDEMQAKIVSAYYKPKGCLRA